MIDFFSFKFLALSSFKGQASQGNINLRKKSDCFLFDHLFFAPRNQASFFFEKGNHTNTLQGTITYPTWGKECQPREVFFLAVKIVKSTQRYKNLFGVLLVGSCSKV